jgi:hypothetical protein
MLDKEPLPISPEGLQMVQIEIFCRERALSLWEEVLGDGESEVFQ